MSGAVSSGRPLSYYVDGLAEGRRGMIVQRKAHRTVWHVDDDGYFAKCGEGRKRAEVRQEAENARLVADEGLGPRVLASGTHDGAEWLVTEDAGAGFLSSLHRPVMERRARQTTIRVGEAIRRFHGLGFSWPDMIGRHVRLMPPDESIGFIDVARLEASDRPAADAERARDLAALIFSTWGWGHGSRRARVRLVRTATGYRGDRLRRLLARIEPEVLRLAGRTRWRVGACWRDVEALPSLMEAFAVQDLVWYPELMRRFGGTVVRALPDRENRTYGRDAAGRPLFYSKVFPAVRTGTSPALAEVIAIERFQRAGIPVNRLAAYGEDSERGSVSVVHACPGEPLDDLLRRGVTPRERRTLARQTAEIWRRMRQARLRHRDAYACHVFVARTGDPDRFDVRLIDLTRAGIAPWPKERWFVKDAAQLWHGARPAGATRTDAVRWLRAYFREDRLSVAAKSFARAVAAKERTIEARSERRRRRAK